ncbi:tRNA dihydrouridine synthase DusB [Phyllobacterium phragmitis]|uniref:tRNA dihydrouridine synthase DusB n=1 Tax=Phyllobacterium phragmitis TaxID=2670329 RepID=UPI0024781971|nr:tRNA dihydrouridine synthase DusB [Phyllobacterium phragmitis]
MTILGEALYVGDVRLRNRVFLAPMSGVSDLPFRRLAWAAGAGMVVSEMVASAELCSRDRESLMRMKGEGLATHVVQIAGREAYWMGEAARIAEAEGAHIIDINMGCPAKKVTGGYSGSALMRDLDHAMTLIEATVAAVHVPVTLKMRLGWDEHSINAPELARRAEDAGVRMVAVHGRTRCQFYEGKADWDAIRAVRQAISIPLVANGDVLSSADAEEILERSGADGVMIGRGCYGQPWLAGMIACGLTEQTAKPDTICDYVIAHYEAMLNHYGSSTGTRHARKHLGWYLDRHAGSELSTAGRAAIMTEGDPAIVIKKLAQALSGGSQPTELKKVA